MINMRNAIKMTGLLLIIIALSCPVNSQINSSNSTDSIKVCNTVNEFYAWYLAAIDEKYNTDYKPRFVEDTLGYVTLDFSVYFKKLEEYGFSVELLQKEFDSYSECMRNLLYLKFEDYKERFTDLYHYEETDCDFGNSFRWIGGQEPVEGVEIETVSFKDESIAKVELQYYWTGSNGEKIFYPGNEVLLVRNEGIWEITNIQSWNQYYTP